MKNRQLRVFVGSAMTELRDVRSVLNKALEDRGIEPFVYEAAAGAQPDTITETSLRELRESDVFIGLFWQKHPEGDATGVSGSSQPRQTVLRLRP